MIPIIISTGLQVLFSLQPILTVYQKLTNILLLTVGNLFTIDRALKWSSPGGCWCQSQATIVTQCNFSPGGHPAASGQVPVLVPGTDSDLCWGDTAPHCYHCYRASHVSTHTSLRQYISDILPFIGILTIVTRPDIQIVRLSITIIMC